MPHSVTAPSPGAAPPVPEEARFLTDQEDKDQQTKVGMAFVPVCLSTGEARPPNDAVKKEG